MSFKFSGVTRAAVVALVLAGGFGTRVCGQDPLDKAFDTVPVAQRAQLVRSLRTLIDYEKTRQYDKVFDLLYKGQQAGDQNPTRESYSATRQKTSVHHGTIKEFVPIMVVDVTLKDGDPITYRVTGHATVESKTHTIKKEMTLFAKLENDTWRFSELTDSYFDYSKR